jgi:hypothetical protein
MKHIASKKKDLSQLIESFTNDLNEKQLSAIDGSAPDSSSAWAALTKSVEASGRENILKRTQSAPALLQIEIHTSNANFTLQDKQNAIRPSSPKIDPSHLNRRQSFP